MKYRREDGTLTTKLRWTAPTENTDGSPIDYSLAYNLYVDGALFSSFPGSLNPDGKYETDIAPLGLAKGTHTLSLSAFDTAKPERESVRSNSIQIEVFVVPKPPMAFSAE